MRAIKGRDTKPELFLRKRLHALGFRYRLNAKSLPGSPDIVLPKYRAAIFVHGCFWHRHDCVYFKMPGTRPEFWAEKLGGNVRRDAIAQAALKEAGWRSLVVWECAVRASMKSKSETDVVALVTNWLKSFSDHATIDEAGLREH